jgi:hypothetical protein
MNTINRSGRKTDQNIGKSLGSLEKTIRKCYVSVLAELRTAEPVRVESLFNTARALAALQAALARIEPPVDPEGLFHLRGELHQLSASVMEAIQSPQDQYGARPHLAQVLEILVSTDEHLLEAMVDTDSGHIQQPPVTILVRTDLLYQAIWHCSQPSTCVWRRDGKRPAGWRWERCLM